MTEITPIEDETLEVLKKYPHRLLLMGFGSKVGLPRM